MAKKTFTISLVLTCAILASCANTQTDENVPQATIYLEKIIDKETQQPIENNTITSRWETPEGEIINTEQYKNQDSLTTVMPADGSVRLFIEGESSDYKTRENALRMNWNEARPFYITVEMELGEEVQG